MLQQGVEHVVGSLRSEQNRLARGRTLVIGAGTGLDVDKLGPEVTELVLNEPEPYLRTYLERMFPGASLCASHAEQLDLDDAQFDTVVSSLVLCSVDKLHKVLQEINRVLRPGGQYVFLEHVGHGPGLRRTVQNVLNPVWKPLAGGCNLNRDLLAALNDSPLELVRYDLVKPGLILPIVAGQAHRP